MEVHAHNPWGGRGQREAQNIMVILGYKASSKASLGNTRHHLENRKEKKKSNRAWERKPGEVPLRTNMAPQPKEKLQNNKRGVGC